jgi:phenylpropionate dioxygenase-like ring-hydroxylating dioxygenase large terminal subunit
VPVTTELWAGFIFVNLDPNAPPLAEYLGRFGAGIESYPFHLMTQKHTFRAEIGSNWKLFIDAFMEFYHAPVLHAKQSTDEESRKLQSYGYEALAYDIDGPHAMVSSWGGMSPPKDLKMVKPIERILRSGLFGPWDGPDIGDLPEGVNPSRHPSWGVDSFLFFPNFMILLWKPNWYLTYHYWPTSYNTHVFETSLYFAPPQNAYERLQQELAVVTFKEYGLQDANTLEATQTMLESRAVTEFPLCDQEVPLRHLHTTCRRYVAEHHGRQAAAARVSAVSREERATCPCSPRSSPTSSRSPTGRWRASTTATASASRARWTSSRRSTTRRSPASRTVPRT